MRLDKIEVITPLQDGYSLIKRFGDEPTFEIWLGTSTIRDFIAFPKNNSGRDVMIDAPAPIDDEQLNELSLKLNIK